MKAIKKKSILILLLIAALTVMPLSGCSDTAYVEQDSQPVYSGETVSQTETEAYTVPDEIYEDEGPAVQTETDKIYGAEDTAAEVQTDGEKKFNEDSFSSEMSTQSNKQISQSVEITMLDVGQGLSILIEADGKYAIYDGGGRSSSSYVVSYLQKHGVTELEYMFVSHYDEDHIAGLEGVLNTLTVKNVICPDYEAETSIYTSFINMRDKSGASVIHPEYGDVFMLGGAEIEVISQSSKYYQEENNRSVAVRISFGDFSCLITGDAESEAEKDMLNSGAVLKSTLYVVGHHGSSSSSSESFLSAVSPEYAFISSGSDNSYGHPTEKTLNTLKSFNVRIFRSDCQGEVTCYSDGITWWFSTEPTDNWTAGGSGSSSGSSTDASKVSDGSDSISQSYILNTNTMKFHYPSCSSVGSMSEKNRQEYTGTRDELIEMGYSPCGNCNP